MNSGIQGTPRLQEVPRRQQRRQAIDFEYVLVRERPQQPMQAVNNLL